METGEVRQILRDFLAMVLKLDGKVEEQRVLQSMISKQHQLRSEQNAILEYGKALNKKRRRRSIIAK